jgi:transcriptional regulator with XRE-family HTH domain
MGSNNDIGSILKDLRIRMGYSQEQISSYLGISQPAYNHYESGDTVVSQDSLEKLADIYGVEEYDILTCNKPQLQADIAFAFRKKGEVNNLAQIASFQRLVKNYLDMCDIERRHE